jgi:hypothetical protein
MACPDRETSSSESMRMASTSSDSRNETETLHEVFTAPSPAASQIAIQRAVGDVVALAQLCVKPRRTADRI